MFHPKPSGTCPSGFNFLVGLSVGQWVGDGAVSFLFFRGEEVPRRGRFPWKVLRAVAWVEFEVLVKFEGSLLNLFLSLRNSPGGSQGVITRFFLQNFPTRFPFSVSPFHSFNIRVFSLSAHCVPGAVRGSLRRYSLHGLGFQWPDAVREQVPPSRCGAAAEPGDPGGTWSGWAWTAGSSPVGGVREAAGR